MVKHLVDSSFFAGLVFSLMLGVSQVSLFGVWVGLELNMLMFVASMSGAKGNLELESMKYFIVQSIGSSVFLSSVVLGALQVSHSLLGGFMGVSLVLKLGVAPFHSWFVSVLSGLSWKFLFLASTLQKVLPLYLFSLIIFDPLFYLLVVSAAVSVLGSLHQLETKKLLSYSSIFSAVWMLGCESQFSVLIQYLSAYAVALGALVGSLAAEGSLSLNEALIKSNTSKTLIFLMGFFSLGGSPPFLGFYVKILVAQVILASGHLFFLLYLVGSSVFLLYVYMRFFYRAILAANPTTEAAAPDYFWSGALVLSLILLGAFPWV